MGIFSVVVLNLLILVLVPFFTVVLNVEDGGEVFEVVLVFD